ncbi:hypothetical protein TNCV_5094301 [Trichonephila clavipes]|nr:hypothetical protein TNCV_5094301 [Trichonephila clavipes]
MDELIEMCEQEQGIEELESLDPVQSDDQMVAGNLTEGLSLIDKKLKILENMDSNDPVVKVSNHGRHVMSSSPVPLKTRRVGQRCALNLSRAETSSHGCGVVARREGDSSGVIHVT